MTFSQFSIYCQTHRKVALYDFKSQETVEGYCSFAWKGIPSVTVYGGDSDCDS